MDEIYLTVKDVAELKGCTERNVRILIGNNSLEAETVEAKGVGPGRGGIQYRIPLAALDSKLQVKYKRRQRQLEQSRIEPAPIPEPEPLDFESITAEERIEVTFWKSIIREWDLHRSIADSKADGDAKFIKLMNEKWKDEPPPFAVNLNRPLLYRKKKALQTKGEAALIDGRGKHQNHARKLTEEMIDIFEYYFLHESKKAVSLCAFLTERELKRRYETIPEMPSIDVFERAAKKIPRPYIMFFRHRRMEFIGKCGPYIARMYEDLEPNDIWVADNHTFDVMVNKSGKSVRLYLTAFMDVKTRKMVGWCVTDNPGSDATIYALKRGVELYGTPKMIYCDNGHEFLFHDFGGNGFRKNAKLEPGEFKPPSILNDLDIEFKTALPANARAKGVERAFYTLKEHFSKLFASYTGGNVLEKPDKLKELVKRPEVLPEVNEFMELVDLYITGFYNKQSHSGEGMWGRTPDEAFAAELYEKRVVPKDKLNLMFMRYSKGTIKVGKHGVALTLYGHKLHYFTADLWREYCGESVYVRYSPDDLSSVRVYNTDKQLICVAPLDTKLGYKATKEELQKKQKEKNQAVKDLKNYKKMKGVVAQDPLDAMKDYCGESLETAENINPKIHRLIQPNEQPLPKAVGFDNEFNELIDWTELLQKTTVGRFGTDLNDD